VLVRGGAGTWRDLAAALKIKTMKVGEIIRCHPFRPPRPVLCLLGLTLVLPPTAPAGNAQRQGPTEPPLTGLAALSDRPGDENPPGNSDNSDQPFDQVLDRETKLLRRSGATRDMKPPKNKITSPANGRDDASEVISVTGTAKDNVGVAAVWYSLNGEEWCLATTDDHWVNWTTPDLDLIPGENTLQAYAVDTSGNVSAIATATFNRRTWSGSWTGVCKTGAGNVVIRMSLTQTGDNVIGYLIEDGSLVGAGVLCVSLVEGIPFSGNWTMPFPGHVHKEGLLIHSSQGQVSFWLTMDRDRISGSETGLFEGTVKLHRN
jgi:hypothetical protein